MILQAIKTVAKRDLNGNFYISVGTGSIRAKRFNPEGCKYHSSAHMLAADWFCMEMGWEYQSLEAGSLGNDTYVHVQVSK